MDMVEQPEQEREDQQEAVEDRNLSRTDTPAAHLRQMDTLEDQVGNSNGARKVHMVVSNTMLTHHLLEQSHMAHGPKLTAPSVRSLVHAPTATDPQDGRRQRKRQANMQRGGKWKSETPTRSGPQYI